MNTEYERVPGFVWRHAHDRLLLRRVGVRDPDAMVEVAGDAMLVWLALDEPGSCDEVAERLSAEVPTVQAAIEAAVAAGLLRAR
jgi:hypothetical protein